MKYAAIDFQVRMKRVFQDDFQAHPRYVQYDLRENFNILWRFCRKTMKPSNKSKFNSAHVKGQPKKGFRQNTPLAHRTVKAASHDQLNLTSMLDQVFYQVLWHFSPPSHGQSCLTSLQSQCRVQTTMLLLWLVMSRLDWTINPLLHDFFFVGFFEI